mmetsp:Transcript_26509/g.61862  ORF Transcript_26509/g.61862 Transcript_26509/m.61862 type:complete len:371 (+) Transcript_26509:112-1224(+)
MEDEDAAAEVIITQFKKDMFKGMNLPLVTGDKGESQCQVKLNKRLTTLTMTSMQKKRTVKLRNISQVFVGEESAAQSKIPADPMGVTLLLDSGKVYGFQFTDEDTRDTFGMCLAMFVDDAKIMPCDAAPEGDDEENQGEKDAMVTDELAAVAAALDAEEEGLDQKEDAKLEAPQEAAPRTPEKPPQDEEQDVAEVKAGVTPVQEDGSMALRPSPEKAPPDEHGDGRRDSTATPAPEEAAEELDEETRRPRRGNCWTRCFVGRRGDDDDDGDGGAKAAPPPEDFHVVLRRRGGKVGMLIGAHVDDPEKVIVREVVRGGLVHAWNQENPTKVVKTGCRILEINGFSERHQMIQCITDSELLQIDLLVRPARQ